VREARPRERQELLHDQLVGGDRPSAEPVELGREAVARRREEVPERVVERHLARDVGMLLREAAHQPEPERRVGDLVHGRRPRRQDPVLDAQMRLAVVMP
jgi:hypothetical protein